MLCLLLFSVVVLRHDDDFAGEKMRRAKSKGGEKMSLLMNTTLESNYTSPSSSSPSPSVVAVSVVVLSTSSVV
jgi:hypothetical protein